MFRKCPASLILCLLFLISLIAVHCVDAKNVKTVKAVKNVKKISKHVNKKVIAKYPQRAGPNAIASQLLGGSLLGGNRMANQLVSSLKMKEIVQPIKKLTRKKMIKLLFKTIKRVNKKAKKESKSDGKPEGKLESKLDARLVGKSNGQSADKSDSKPDSKSNEFRPTFQRTTARSRSPLENGLKSSGDLIGRTTDRINFEISDKDAFGNKQLISRTNGRQQPPLVRRNLRKTDLQLKLGEREPRLLSLESISGQVPATFLASLLNAEQTDERALNALYSNYLNAAQHSIFSQYLNGQHSSAPANSRYSAPDRYADKSYMSYPKQNRLNGKTSYLSDKSHLNDKVYLYKSSFLDDQRRDALTRNELTRNELTRNELTRNELTRSELARNEMTRNEMTRNELTNNPIGDQSIIRIQIPTNELIHFPIYVHDQLNSSNTQSLIRHFIRSQLDRLTARSDTIRKELFSSRLLNFIARQLDIDVDRQDKRAQETVLQTGMTKVLGAFVGKRLLRLDTDSLVLDSWPPISS